MYRARKQAGAVIKVRLLTRAALSVNHEMIEEVHFPYIDWRKPGYCSLPACRLVRQAFWKLKRAWNWMRVIAGDYRLT